MTNKEILRIAMEQSARDINCKASDFLCSNHVIVRSGLGADARKYYKEPISCSLILKVYIKQNGAMHCVRIGKIWIFSVWEHMLMENLLGLRAAQPIVAPCGRLGWMCCKNIEEKG
ncbi:hypothetical protein AALA79_08920 [Lachnospiraceae bacterium 64-25]